MVYLCILLCILQIGASVAMSTSMGQEYKPFAGKAYRVGEDGEVTPATNNEVIEIADEANTDDTSAEREVLQFREEQLETTIKDNRDWLGKLVEVAEGWKLELPMSKFSAQTMMDIESFLDEATTFSSYMTDIQDWDMTEDMVDVIGDIQQGMATQRQGIAKLWAAAKADVDFLMGRASARVRKLKREGSDVPAFVATASHESSSSSASDEPEPLVNTAPEPKPASRPKRKNHESASKSSSSKPKGHKRTKKQ